jgi:hypothetical protein
MGLKEKKGEALQNLRPRAAGLLALPLGRSCPKLYCKKDLNFF